LISLDAAVVGGAEELAGERADHHEILSLAVRPNSRGMVQRIAQVLSQEWFGQNKSGLAKI
jgi:hypothetical protein